MESRKQFIGKSGLGLFAFLTTPYIAISTENNVDFEGIVVNDDEGEAFQLREKGAVVRIKVAKTHGAASMSFLSETFGPGDAIPVHKHENEDELIFLHRGSGVFTLGDKEYEVKEGAIAFVPRGIWHGLRNNSTEKIEMRFSYAPSGFEGFFRDMGTPLGQPFVKKTPEQRKAISEKWGIVYKAQ